MAISSDQINGLIDSNLPDATDRRNRASTVRTLLKLVTAWVRDAINQSGITTWLVNPGNGDTVYRIGNTGIGTQTPTQKLNVADNNPERGWIAEFKNLRGTLGRLGTRVIFTQTDFSVWAIGNPGGDVDAFVIQGWGNGTLPERLRIDTNGNIGIGTSVPTERLQVAGNIQADGFVRAGSGNKAFKITGVKSGAGLTLKTGRYLELTLEDGTIVKVAEVN